MKKHEGHDGETRLQSKAHIQPLFTDAIEISKLNIAIIRNKEMLVSLKNSVQYYIESLQDI